MESSDRPNAETARPYAGLGPDTVLDAVEAVGLITDGRLLALGSYENRVWQVGLEDGEPVVVKFYRPGRWSDAAILEEHDFSRELAEPGLSVVAPTAISGTSLFRHAGYRYAVFPRQGGHAPELAHRQTLEHLGRVLGRMHAVGAASAFRYRPVMDATTGGVPARDWLLENRWIPAPLESAFTHVTGDVLAHVESAWARAGDVARIRLHGDCHPGNILWRNDQAHFVDLDDCRTGPAIQDLWMLISGDRNERAEQLEWLLSGYRTFMEFDPRELHLVEALRAQRMIGYQAWLAQRWEDPAFPAAFPWFDDDRHWEGLIGQLKEQLAELQDPPLQLAGP